MKNWISSYSTPDQKQVPYFVRLKLVQKEQKEMSIFKLWEKYEGVLYYSLFFD